MEWFEESRCSADTEYALMSYVERLQRKSGGLHAVYLRLSALEPSRRPGHRLKIAVATVEQVVSPHDGQIFPLGNSDLVVFCRDADVLDEAICRLRLMFCGDPLIAAGRPRTAFAAAYEVEEAKQSLLKLAQEIHLRALRRSRAATRQAPGIPELDPAALGSLQNALRSMDILRLMLRQPVYILAHPGRPHRLFEELFVSVAALQRRLSPRHGVAESPWLFRSLTQRLDLAVLDVLARRGPPPGVPSFSLNLNLHSLDGDAFRAFDTRIRQAGRAAVVLEFDALDVIANMDRFIAAREWLAPAGYRICLDGLTSQSFPFFCSRPPECDYLKIRWSQDLAAPRQVADLGRLLAATGKERIILSHCDGAAALRLGVALGVIHYQGRHVDRLFGSQSAPTQAAA